MLQILLWRLRLSHRLGLTVIDPAGLGLCRRRIEGGFSKRGLGDLVRQLAELPEIIRGDGAVATTGRGSRRRLAAFVHHYTEQKHSFFSLWI